jgi:hypothetical protein
MAKSKSTTVDRIIEWLKNNKFIAIVLVIGITVIAISQFTKALEEIGSFVGLFKKQDKDSKIQIPPNPVRSAVIDTLSTVKDEYLAKRMILRYETNDLLSSGDRGDFICQNQCYLIIFGNGSVTGLYKLLENGHFYDVHKKTLISEPVIAESQLWLHVFDEIK